MDKKKPSLFIGRFQPFHKGHLSVVKEILAKKENLIIGIGSAEDNFLPENPFTAGERYEMIKSVLQEENLDFNEIMIIPIRNINNYALWVRHVEIYLPKFKKIYSGSEIVQRLFRENKKYEVISVKKSFNISASLIREKIMQNKAWSDFVPQATYQYIQKIDGENRIKDCQKV